MEPRLGAALRYHKYRPRSHAEIQAHTYHPREHWRRMRTNDAIGREIRKRAFALQHIALEIAKRCQSYSENGVHCT